MWTISQTLRSLFFKHYWSLLLEQIAEQTLREIVIMNHSSNSELAFNWKTKLFAAKSKHWIQANSEYEPFLNLSDGFLQTLRRFALANFIRRMLLGFLTKEKHHKTWFTNCFQAGWANCWIVTNNRVGVSRTVLLAVFRTELSKHLTRKAKQKSGWENTGFFHLTFCAQPPF